MAASERGEAVHHLLNDDRNARVIRIHRFARLEKSIRIMGRAAQEGVLGIERAAPVGAHKLLIDHSADLTLIEQTERVDLVRSAEAVEEVEERHTGLERRRLSDQGIVMRLLDRARRKKRKAGHARGHDVGVIAEDR